jgi:adenylosuccinate lyase
MTLLEVGDAIAARVSEHADTAMAARTHAQQAVPTTFGATPGNPCSASSPADAQGHV